MPIEHIVSIGSLFIALISIVASGYNRQLQSERKRYAAERDFVELQRQIDHIKNSMKSLSTNTVEVVDELKDEVLEQRGELKEIKALVLSISSRLEGVLARIGGENTGGWGRNRGE